MRTRQGEVIREKEFNGRIHYIEPINENRLMKKTTYILLVTSSIILCCQAPPDTGDSYTVKNFCFDGYRGIGVASVPVSPGSYEIPVLIEPVEGADLVASLVAEITSAKKTFAVEGDAVAEAALFEFTYEHLGLPVEAIEGDWIRVRLGNDASGNPLSGWISNTVPLMVERWDTYLPERATFLATCDQPVLYHSPGGEAYLPPLKYVYDHSARTRRPDYRIKLLEADGQWMRVQLVTPSDLCGASPQESVVTDGWVPYLLDDGSPAVWFYPRGC